MRRRVTVVLGVAMLLAVIGVPSAVAGFRVVESQPSFCVSCHEERQSYDTWLASGASREHPSCIMCHSGPGVTGVVSAQFRGLTHFVKHVTGNFSDPATGGDVPNEFCTRCHSPGRIAGEHDEFLEFATRECAECHNHKPGARGQLRTLTVSHDCGRVSERNAEQPGAYSR